MPMIKGQKDDRSRLRKPGEGTYLSRNFVLTDRRLLRGEQELERVLDWW